MKYEVLWIKTWKKITIFMSLAISLPLSFTLFSRYREFGSYEKTFEHMSLIEAIVFVVGFPSAFSLLVALFIKFAAVEVKDGYLIGRNYWYFTKRLPISNISNIYPFSHNGVEAMVADGGIHGKVYIPKQTKQLDELVSFIENYNR